MLDWAPEKERIFTQLKQVLRLEGIPLENVKLFGGFVLSDTYNDIDVAVLEQSAFVRLLHRSDEFKPKLHPVLARTKDHFTNWHSLQSFYNNCKTIRCDGKVQEIKERTANGSSFNYNSLAVFNIPAKIIQSKPSVLSLTNPS